MVFILHDRATTAVHNDGGPGDKSCFFARQEQA